MGDARAADASMNSFARVVINNPTVGHTNTESESVRYALTSRVTDELRRTNQPEQTHNTAKHLHNKDLDKQLRVSRVRERSGGTCDADGDTAEEVAYADGQPSPK